jgi:hypothetical protein
MYKIFIVSRYSEGGIHSIVTEFNSREEAEVAIRSINTTSYGFNVQVKAVALF